MNISLLEEKCQGCGVKLTEFEIVEKDSYCMDCFEEEVKNKQI